MKMADVNKLAIGVKSVMHFKFKLNGLYEKVYNYFKYNVVVLLNLSSSNNKCSSFSGMLFKEAIYY